MGAFAARWYTLRKVGVDTGFTAVSGHKHPPPPTSGACTTPCNILLLGSDSRSGLSSGQQGEFGTNQDLGGSTRADTIMLVHLDPDTSKTVVLSFPRDLWVDIPGHGTDKINSAFEGGAEHGGPQLMAKTIFSLTHIPVDHYLYVDLNGFQQAVDKLGGVDMCIPSYYVNTPGDLEAVDASGNSCTSATARWDTSRTPTRGSTCSPAATTSTDAIAGLRARAAQPSLQSDP